MKKKRTPPEPKKRPRQERSRATVDSILQAAAQILGRDGPDHLSTNRIAARAGVAVASVYQYFPNKEAIVNALFQMQLSEERAEVASRSAGLEGQPLAEAIRVGVRSTIAVHATKPKLVNSILESMPLVGGTEAHQLAREQVVELVHHAMRQRSSEIRSPKNLAIKAFLVVHAVEAAIHDAANEHPEFLTDPAFSDELIDMVQRFLL